MIRRQRRGRMIVNLADVGRMGRRYCAFYHGYKAQRAGNHTNPHDADSEEHECWNAGYEFAGDDPAPPREPPVCRFGPGGDFVHDWPPNSDSETES